MVGRGELGGGGRNLTGNLSSPSAGAPLANHHPAATRTRRTAYLSVRTQSSHHPLPVSRTPPDRPARRRTPSARGGTAADAESRSRYHGVPARSAPRSGG